MKKLSLIWTIALIFIMNFINVFALEGGTQNSYSADPAKYLFWTKFNGTNGAVIPNMETGETISEGGSSAWDLRNGCAFHPIGLTASNICIAESPTKNFTRMVFWNSSTAMDYNLILRSWSTTDCATTQATLFGIRAGVVKFWESGTTTEDLLNFTPLAGRNYSFIQVNDVTNFRSNYTIAEVTNSSGTIYFEVKGSTGWNTWANSVTSLGSFDLRHDFDTGSDVCVDEDVAWNWTDKADALSRPAAGGGAPDTTPPEINQNSYNMTSEGGEGCINWRTDKTIPCSTGDTTPTVNFTTNEAAWCAIGTQNINFSDYNNLGVNRNCTTGQGATSHTCTLVDQDELVYENSTAYLSCKDSSGNMNITSTSGALSLTITGLEAAGDAAIGAGIQNALLSGYTNYTSLQIYARNLSNGQAKGRFDWAAKKGSKVWAFNYVTKGETHAALFNLTPVLYVLEMSNITGTNITKTVETMINATR